MTDTTPTPPVTPPVAPTTPPADKGTTDFDPSKLNDEEYAKFFDDPRAFKHERFKSLNDRAKKADEYEAAQTEAERKKLEDEKKFEELSTNLKSENETLKQQAQTLKIDISIQGLLVKEKVIDSNAALKLIDRSLITVDKDGSVSGADKAIEALKASSPYLFGEGGTTSLGNDGGNPKVDPNASGKKFKLSQIQDHEFFQKNRDEILAAQRAGNIEDDVNVNR